MKLYYRIHNSQLLDPVTSQTNPIPYIFTLIVVLLLAVRLTLYS
jgi:hypothetical protein